MITMEINLIDLLVTGAAWIGIIAFLWHVATGTFFTVKQQNVVIIERFGKFARVAEPGLNIKIPFIELQAGTVGLRLVEQAEKVVVKSSDNSFLTVPVKVQQRVIVGKAKDAFYQLSEAQEQIGSYIVNVVRSTATGMTMEEIFQNKDKFEVAVAQELNTKFNGFGFEIVNVLVDDPMPSTEVVNAFNRVIASKREMEAATNEAEAARIKLVGVANAEAESLTIKATAYVEQRKTIVDGMKEVIGKEDLADYLVGIDWRDTIRDAAQKGNIIMVPTPGSGSNIGEIVAAVKAVSK